MESLTQIKQHPKYPFRNYREDDEQYLMSQIYWMELFKSVAHKTLLDWSAWLQPLPDRDGGSIFSAICSKLNRGIVVNQYSPTKDDIAFEDGGSYSPFVVWIDTLGDATDQTVEHMTINSNISEECEVLARRFIEMYVVERRSTKEINYEIEKLEGKI